ncbi:MAG TPA: methylated-DNA--[protein]-cysteine S-methyltransferase [Bryobacteraceae bacterium]|nr:methylated-DNA--[protein]-cysteine S-methyltransferase [Bryobacteraceae bacterium]
METPIGPLVLAGDRRALRQLRFFGRQEEAWIVDRAPFRDAIDQLKAYFAGKLTDFDLSLAPEGTPFQQSVWDALLTIPYGETTSYSAVARQIGRPNAIRAVGAANGANPIPIIIPCHRVIGSNGKLTGFGGGLPTKEHLLKLESKQLHIL